MPEPEALWCCYWARGFKSAYQSAPFFSVWKGAVMAAVIALLTFYERLKTLDEVRKVFFVALAAYFVGWIIEILWKAIFVEPVKKSNDAQRQFKKFEAQIASLRVEIDANDILDLSFEHDAPDWTGRDMLHACCRIVVKNISTSKTAEKVSLSLTSITFPIASTPSPATFEFGASGKAVPVLSESGGIIHPGLQLTTVVDIHPGASQAFDIFRYSRKAADREFQFIVRPAMLPPLEADDFTANEWQFSVRATGKHITAKTKKFKLESNLQSSPRCVAL